MSPGAKYEFEIYIMGVLAGDGGDGIRYGLCAIGGFKEMISVILIINRSPSETIRGLKLIVEELGNQSRYIVMKNQV